MEKQNLEDKIKICIELIGKDNLDECKLREYIQLHNELRESKEKALKEYRKIETEHDKYMKDVIWKREDRRYTAEEWANMQAFQDKKERINRSYYDQEEEFTKKIEELRPLKTLGSVIQNFEWEQKQLDKEYSWTLKDTDREIEEAKQKIEKLEHEKEDAKNNYDTIKGEISKKLSALYELSALYDLYNRI